MLKRKYRKLKNLPQRLVVCGNDWEWRIEEEEEKLRLRRGDELERKRVELWFVVMLGWEVLEKSGRGSGCHS